MTRAGTKKAKEALQQVLTLIMEFQPKSQVKKPNWANCIMAQEEGMGAAAAAH